MKIALLSAFYPYRGGIAQFGAQLYRALEEENQLEAFTFKRQYPDFLFPGETQFVTDDDNADQIDALRVLDTINPLSYSRTAEAINAFEPDLLISQYWMTFFGPAMAGVHKRINKKTKRIAILHNVIPHEKRFFDKPANNRFLPKNEGFVVMSDAVLEDLLSLQPNAKYLRIDHPVYNQFGESVPKTNALEELGLPKDAKYILFFGFIRGYKGLDLLIEALNYVSEDVHLIIAGEAYGSFDSYRDQINQSAANPRIHTFVRYISDDEVKLFFSAADVCVLPYKGATQSGITAIAHHFNLPIIATDVGGLKENIQHGETGLIVPQPDSELIGNAIDRYFVEGLKSTFAANIQEKKHGNTWEQFAKEILAFADTI